MSYTQLNFKSDKAIISYTHPESGKSYGLAIKYIPIDLDSFCSWIQKAKTSIARQVYHVHDVILDDFKPSEFEKSKLSPEEYVQKLHKESLEAMERSAKQREKMDIVGSLLLSLSKDKSK